MGIQHRCKTTWTKQKGFCCFGSSSTSKGAVLVLSSLPLSGRLVTCPWYWEYHSVEFSVPASGQNLELSVPTHLVLTVCKEKSLICIRMSHKETLCCSDCFKPKPQKHFSKACCSQEPVLLRRKMGKVDFPLTFWRQQNQARKCRSFREEKPGK